MPPSYSVLVKPSPTSTSGTPAGFNVTSLSLEEARRIAALALDLPPALIGLIPNGVR